MPRLIYEWQIVSFIEELTSLQRIIAVLIIVGSLSAYWYIYWQKPLFNTIKQHKKNLQKLEQEYKSMQIFLEQQDTIKEQHNTNANLLKQKTFFSSTALAMKFLFQIFETHNFSCKKIESIPEKKQSFQFFIKGHFKKFTNMLEYMKNVNIQIDRLEFRKGKGDTVIMQLACCLFG